MGGADFAYIGKRTKPRPKRIVQSETNHFEMAVNDQPGIEYGEDEEKEASASVAEQGKERRKRYTSQNPPMKERLYSSLYRLRYGRFV